MSTQAETIPEFECVRDISSLYSSVDFKSKAAQRKKLERRESDKIEFTIPPILDTPAEFRNSDSNLYASIDTTLPSHSLYNSDSNLTMIDQTDNPMQQLSMNLFRNNTGPMVKIRAPPPAIPPPYRIREEPESKPLPNSESTIQSTIQSTGMRRTKSIGSTPLVKVAAGSEKKGEDLIGGKANAKSLKTLIHSFRNKETNPVSKPGTVPTQPLRPLKSDIKTPLASVPTPPPKPQHPILPPTAQLSKSSDSLYSTPESSLSPVTPFTPLSFTTKPVLSSPTSVPIRPAPTNRNHSMPSLIKNAVANSPLKKPLSISPTTSPIAKKPPARLPPPPPSKSLTFPRNTLQSIEKAKVDIMDDSADQIVMKKSTSIGDYTLLVPVSPGEESEPRQINEDISSPPHSPPPPGPLPQYDTAYTVLNLDDIEPNNDIVDKPKISLKSKLDFKRTASLPDQLESSKSAPKPKGGPPKKPPRRPHRIPSPVTAEPNYCILSPDEPPLEPTVESDAVTSLKEETSTDRPMLTADSRTFTMPCHGTRTPPANPTAYRNRAHSHNIANQLNTLLSPGEDSVESPTSTQYKHKTIGSHSHSHPHEGGVFTRVFQMSKKFRSRDHSEHPSKEISKPIPVSQSAHKVLGLNPLLVSECVAYLRQPRSLREEGLFRIPGDLNQIHFYLRQYDYSVKANIDEELDPNTIASVLKNHVRDKGGFMPKKEATDLFAAARQKNIEEMANIIVTLPEENQKMMKELFYLFKEVSQHEKENKMGAGIIATSCGLSVFPILNAGNANLMLKSLIDNAETIFPE